MSSPVMVQHKDCSCGLYGSGERPVCTPIGPLPPAPPPAREDEDDDGGPSDERKILGEVILAKIHVRRDRRNPAALAPYLNLPPLIPLIRKCGSRQLSGCPQ
ncbi:hypothetical protein B0H13DRAFT_2180950 [Mycena leptocephala]|nr:hypothetical protein B0H13DRAFT_2180950 [Mycena leptocephala]